MSTVHDENVMTLKPSVRAVSASIYSSFEVGWQRTYTLTVEPCWSCGGEGGSYAACAPPGDVLQS